MQLTFLAFSHSFRHFPGELEKVMVWFRDYKIPDGKPANKYGFDNKCMDRAFANKVSRTDKLKRVSGKIQQFEGSESSSAGNQGVMEVSMQTSADMLAALPAQLVEPNLG